MHSLSQFTLRDMAELGLALRQASQDADHMEAAAQALVTYLYKHCPGAALVRLFKTHPYGGLSADLQQSVQAGLSATSANALKCLTLLATAGTESAWCDRHSSQGHQVIPLTSVEGVQQIPMIAQLIQQFGLDIENIVEPDPALLVKLEQRNFNVFHIPCALGSPFIPSQAEFVQPYGIESVLGFGGLLPSGNLFTMIIFSQVTIPRSTAEMFQSLALSVKLALLPFDGEVHFGDRAMAAARNDNLQSRLQSEVTTLRQLLTVSEQSTLEQSDRLEQTISKRSETLKQLQATQADLIQSEKMAALGQLVAGVAHELNTPLGAIRSSVEYLQETLGITLNEFPQFFSQLTPQEQSQLRQVTTQAQSPTRILTSREKRKLRRKLTQELEAEGLETEAEELADTLVDLGFQGDLSLFLPLLHHPERDRHLEYVYQIAMVHQSAQTIATATERAAKVVFALRTYARQDQSSEKVCVDLTEGMETILTLYHNQLKQGVEVSKDYDDNLPKLWCYVDELNQVWTNLIHNALQAMDYKGQLAIAIHEYNQVIHVQITDSGSGIAPEHRDRIFEPFFTTKPPGEGSGLGLDIVQRIVEKHGGEITANSEPGRTTFTVTLPLTV
ncbi:MAG: GHKL domain-containing protein [Spirulina sp. SIO3F2]|nr:GHKL domain-containing protein [Spirulina sp. SIO3F2]